MLAEEDLPDLDLAYAVTCTRRRDRARSASKLVDVTLDRELSVNARTIAYERVAALAAAIFCAGRPRQGGPRASGGDST
jgi:hypothetical protein